jgi:membrane-associated phospholipid phosphatase
MLKLYDIISISVILIYIIPAIMYYYTGNIREIIAIVGAFATVTISEGIKYGIIGCANPRPKSAYDCNLFCTDGLQEGRPGMPSGHSGLVGFFVGYYWNETTNKWVNIGLVIFAALVMYSRYIKKCHSIAQIVLGGLFGSGMSILVKRLI